MSSLNKFVASTQENVFYASTIAVLALLSLAMLIYEITLADSPQLIKTLQTIDLVIATIFLTDFFMGLFFNKKVSKSVYFKHNWLNLISSIPVTADAIRILRILRVLRAFRVIRASTNLFFAEQRLKRNRKLH